MVKVLLIFDLPKSGGGRTAGCPTSVKRIANLSKIPTHDAHSLPLSLSQNVFFLLTLHLTSSFSSSSPLSCYVLPPPNDFFSLTLNNRMLVSLSKSRRKKKFSSRSRYRHLLGSSQHRHLHSYLVFSLWKSLIHCRIQKMRMKEKISATVLVSTREITAEQTSRRGGKIPFDKFQQRQLADFFFVRPSGAF